MDRTSRAILATMNLYVTRTNGLVLVNDGQTQWLCEATDYDEAVASLARETVKLDGMDAVERQEVEMMAYAELCDRITGPVAADGGGNGQGEPEEKAALVRRAVEAGLLDEDDPLVKRYTATGQGE